MRDGKSLVADVYVPRTATGKLPTVLVQTPYGKNGMFRRIFAPSEQSRSELVKQSLFLNPNYAFVVLDWRGSGASKEAGPPPTEGREGPDGVDTIKWIAQQEWSDGKVGMWGPSALGLVQFRTLMEEVPPALKAAVPLVHPANITFDLWFPGGVMSESFVKYLSTLGSDNTKGGDLKWDFYNTLAERPYYDDDWKSRQEGMFTKPAQIEVPILMIEGWYDIYVDQMIDFFQRVKKGGPTDVVREQSRLLIGPWPHGTGQAKSGDLEFPNAALYDTKHALAFFDYWLRGDQAALDPDAPQITYYQMGANEWRQTDAWPPAGSKQTAFNLQGDRTLATAVCKTGPAFTEFVYDPRDPAPTIGGHVLDPALHSGPRDQREKVESRKDVVVFSTPALEQDLAVAGPLSVKLWVSTDRTDTDFSAILTDVHPDGRSMLISEGIRRLRFRNGYAKEELATPGEIYELEIPLIATANTFLKGHQVRIVVSSASWPKYARNLNDGGKMYGQDLPSGVVATNRIHHDPEHPSALVLPVVAK
jgi:predicted acyl esterase